MNTNDAYIAQMAMAEGLAMNIRRMRGEDVESSVEKGQIKSILDGLGNYPPQYGQWLAFHYPECLIVKFPLLMAKGDYSLEQVINAVRAFQHINRAFSDYWEDMYADYGDSASLLVRIAWWSPQDLRFLSEKDTRLWLSELSEDDIGALWSVCDTELCTRLQQNGFSPSGQDALRSDKPASTQGMVVLERVLARVIAGVERGEMSMPLKSFSDLPIPCLERALTNELAFTSHPNDTLKETCHRFLFEAPDEFDDDFMVEVAKSLSGPTSDNKHVFRRMLPSARERVMFWVMSLGYSKYRNADPARQEYAESLRKSFYLPEPEGGFNQNDDDPEPGITSEQRNAGGQLREIIANIKNILSKPSADNINFLEKPPHDPLFEFVHENMRKAISDLSDQGREALLEALKQRDEIMYRDARNSWYDFEALNCMPYLDVQVLLRHLDKETLAYALKGAPFDVYNLFMENISERAAEFLVEDMEAMGPVREAKVNDAQQSIMKTVRDLERSGEISRL
ncbi:FliG C-terminal domain-containing protein [Magnetovibrio sp. PR-2]|uniref:FliG C-terminal domain-containing protein n=1 Tax=Magnetovibrio sp. PR-2 TaxID=3120356 RepID=UPI002FCDF7A8